MNTVEAMARAQFAEDTGTERFRVFDWKKAAKILKERNPQEASAGLEADYEWTGGVIWRDGEPVHDEYTYLASSWAQPMLIIDGEEIPCWVDMDGTGWGANTKWPEGVLP